MVQQSLILSSFPATKLDSVTYVRRVLEPALVPFSHQCCEEYGWAIVQEDNAPGHKGYAKAYRELNGMETLEWLAESPDLNPVGACWGDVEMELGEIWGRAAHVEALQLYLAVCWARVITECIGREHACEITSCH